MRRRHLTARQRAWRIANREYLNQYNRERWYRDNYTGLHGVVNRIGDAIGWIAGALILCGALNLLVRLL